MNKIAWVIESVLDLAIYLNIQQYTTIMSINIRRDNLWFNCVLQAISGIFIIIKYIYNPMIIDIAFAVYRIYYLPCSVTKTASAHKMKLFQTLD